MKDIISYITTEKNNYPVVFNLNVMEEIQEEYGSMQKWGEATTIGEDGEPKIKDIKAGLMAMINEAIDICNEAEGDNRPFVNSKQVGRIISEVGFDAITQTIHQLTVASTRTGDELKNE